jgi:hypothetical protein
MKRIHRTVFAAVSLSPLALALALALAACGGGRAESLSRRASPVLAWGALQARVPDPYGKPAAFFGDTVALQGDTLLGGATGHAHVFVRSAGAFGKQATFDAPASTPVNDAFPTSVALDGDTALIGAASGGAYVYVRSAGSWTQQAKLVPAAHTTNDSAGHAVALRGDVAVLSSIGKNAVYVFTRSGSTWTEAVTLNDPAGDANPWFGTSLAMDGGTLVVGAKFAHSVEGAAYVYVGAGATWSLQGTLLAPDGGDHQLFGRAVAVSKGTVAVGAPNANGQHGAAYVFTRSGTTWSLQKELLSPETADTQEAFGSSLALSGDTLLVGEPDGRDLRGAAWAYTRTSTTWGAPTSLAPDDLAVQDAYGTAVALDGATAAIGAPLGNVTDGVTYVFTTAHPDGETCAVDGDCLSGHCTEKVCCASPSCGPCGTCAGATPGKCQLRARGDLPGTSCGAYACDGAASTCPTTCTGALDCASGATCDGSGHCQKKTLGSACTTSASCASGTCVDGVCCKEVCAAGFACNVAGHEGTCVRPKGAGCADDASCATGHCVDGVCCDAACAGQCEACDVAGSVGTCAPAFGAPHGARTACAKGGDVCGDRTCDGTKDRTACVGFAHGTTTACGQASCVGATYTEAPRCDGAGACLAPTSTSCVPFACGASGCLSSCASSTDCAPGFACVGGACTQGAKCSDDRTESIPKTGGEPLSCAPYLCGDDGSCMRTCKTTNDCAQGSCDGEHCIVTLTQGSAADGGCTTSARRSSQDAGGDCAAWALVGAGALATAARRRRART